MLEQYINESKYIVLLTGAGISTESGIPDFRSVNNGRWKKVNPRKVGSTFALRFHKKRFYEFYKDRIESLEQARPNVGHHIISKWQKEGRVHSIITQNVDGFHQDAGSHTVYEIHGSIRTVRCTKCENSYSSTTYVQEDGQYCECGKFLRPEVVLFGENLPEHAIQQAREEVKKADLLIVLGSSLQVSPANKLLQMAKENGAKVVIINWEETIMDKFADCLIHNRKIGEVLQEVDNALSMSQVQKEDE
ncbi:NAD-dependent protein deacylase [Bacillus thuringiensis]|uniref:NAD-dependent protein deacylase n=1 Tax=Bacillus thuringiensis TaxID=1428 RepID=UPI0021D6546C|nr:NAD-dependent protein deacylase [Bacillus thuringiensis]MCU7667442.1 NAD-dependent protein deacylase [Bacillus thuringiensis]